jgi:hypothetical protein
MNSQMTLVPPVVRQLLKHVGVGGELVISMDSSAVHALSALVGKSLSDSFPGVQCLRSETLFSLPFERGQEFVAWD